MGSSRASLSTHDCAVCTALGSAKRQPHVRECTASGSNSKRMTDSIKAQCEVEGHLAEERPGGDGPAPVLCFFSSLRYCHAMRSPSSPSAALSSTFCCSFSALKQALLQLKTGCQTQHFVLTFQSTFSCTFPALEQAPEQLDQSCQHPPFALPSSHECIG